MKHSSLYLITVSTIVLIAVIRGVYITSLQAHQFEFLRLRGFETAGSVNVDDAGGAGELGREDAASSPVAAGEGTNPAPSVVERTTPVQANPTEVHAEAEEEEEEGDEEEDAGGVPFAAGRTDESCDVFSGRWVRDETSRPHYTEEGCPFISSQMRCLAHGRPEKAYQFWRWQPHGCSLPSFNATLMMEKLRGKSMLFVGDSLGASQYFSMACLVHKETPLKSAKLKNIASLQTLKSEEYNATIEFYWAPFLVKSNCDNSGKHKVTEADRMIHLYAGALEKHADNWKDADVLIFNTYTWWNTKTAKIKTLTSESNMKRISVMDTRKAYKLVMQKMVKWVEKNMDPRKTRVFFTTMSPTHWKSQDWGGKQNMNCYGETTPIRNQTYWGSGASKSIMKVVGDAVHASRVPIAVNNITQLSESRRDAHTTIYKDFPATVTPEELMKNPRSHSDCVHWCIPGVQDTWNELLYTKLLFPSASRKA